MSTNDISKDTKEKSKAKTIIISITILILLACSLLLYSRYVETSGLNIKEYKVTSEKITDNFHGLKIVHLSDIHYGTTIDEKSLKNIVDKINTLKPDIVVLTGDLLDTETNINDSYDIIVKQLSNIKTTIGKYAIKGDQDYNFNEWDSIIENSGFINLNNTYTKIYKNKNNYLLLSGVDSNIYDNDINKKLQTTKDLLNNLNEDERNATYKILLLHEPDYIDYINDVDFDLILAGHSLGGQIRIPFIGSIKSPNGALKYHKDYYKINNSNVYVSTGLGTTKYKFRLFNKPSINFYRIMKK